MKILIYQHKEFLSSVTFEIRNGTDIHIKPMGNNIASTNRAESPQ